MEKGLIQVYTGDGKGKTTAAIGQGIRALGSGNKVYMIQFLKSSDTGELKTLKLLEPHFKLFRFERKRGFVWTLNSEEMEELKKDIERAFSFALEALEKKLCDILILDEIMGVLSNSLLTVNQVTELLDGKPENIEVILTGRNVPEDILKRAHYVSEINCVKHPFQKGIEARPGIEF